METQEFKTVDQEEGVDIFDIFFDFSILFIVFGVIVFILAFFGAIGALRENVVLLKIVSGIIFDLVQIIENLLTCLDSQQWDDKSV